MIMSLAVTQLVGFGCKRSASGACSCTPSYVTGDRTASITGSASGITMNSGSMSELLDGSTSDNTGFWPSGMSSASYMQFDFGSGNSIKITETKVYQGPTATNWGTWKWQGSNDGSSWTDLTSSFTFAGAGDTTDTSLSGNTTGYRYYRLQAVSPTASPASTWIDEIEFKQCTC